MKQVTIVLPEIKAVSRNNTTGHYINYKTVLNTAEAWMGAFGKKYEYHFKGRVDVAITAYYDCRYHDIILKKGKRAGQRSKVRHTAVDSPNIDDKILTDILIRYKQQKQGPKLERSVWFIEDDSPKYLRKVTKQSVPSDKHEVVITITEVDEGGELEQ